MLRIGVVSRYFPSSAEPWQGRSAYETLRMLSRHADVKVFYPHASYPSWLRRASSMDDRLDLSYGTPDVAVEYVNYPALPVLSRVSNGWMAARRLLPAVRDFAPHMILSYFVYPEGFAALTLAGALSIPVVVEAIGSDINRIGDPVTRMLTRAVLRKADFVLTVSEDLRKKSVGMGASLEKSCTILNGCDPSVFYVRDRREARVRLGIDPTAPSIVYIGRIDIKKGLRELVEASASVRTLYPNLQVYMVGWGPDRELIRNRIRMLNTTEYVHLQDACAPDEVPLWIASADLVTLPSYMEGCPNVVLEALACGRPVVATNVGGIPEILNEQYGCLVAPRDARALAQGLATVLARKHDPIAISSSNSRSWEILAAECFRLFDNLVTRHEVRA